MKVSEAIELLEEALEDANEQETPQYVAALKLGIEALKLVQRERLLGINPVETKLPGETEEEEN